MNLLHLWSKCFLHAWPQCRLQWQAVHEPPCSHGLSSWRATDRKHKKMVWIPKDPKGSLKDCKVKTGNWNKAVCGKKNFKEVRFKKKNLKLLIKESDPVNKRMCKGPGQAHMSNSTEQGWPSRHAQGGQQQHKSEATRRRSHQPTSPFLGLWLTFWMRQDHGKTMLLDLF